MTPSILFSSNIGLYFRQNDILLVTLILLLILPLYENYSLKNQLQNQELINAN